MNGTAARLALEEPPRGFSCAADLVAVGALKACLAAEAERGSAS